jgi:hypothetical protein
VITASDGKFFFGDFPHDVPMQLIVSSEGYEEQTIDRLLTRPAAKQTALGHPYEGPRELSAPARIFPMSRLPIGKSTYAALPHPVGLLDTGSSLAGQ